MTGIDDRLGRFSIELHSETWHTGAEGAAVAEIVPQASTRLAELDSVTTEGLALSQGAGDARRVAAPNVTVSIGVNGPPQAVSVVPGDYNVRLYLPNGEIMAESVSVTPISTGKVRFDLRRSPHEWLGSESAYGAVQRLPNPERARALEALRSDSAEPWEKGGSEVAQDQRRNVHTRVSQAIVDLDAGSASVERISGAARIRNIYGKRHLTRVDPQREIPTRTLSTEEFVRWWTGIPEPDSVPLEIVNHDERNAKLATPNNHTSQPGLMSGEQRAFAAIKDPSDSWYYAVLPEGWVRSSGIAPGTTATADVLMTVVIDSVMRSSTETGESARWRCVPSVADVEAMSYLGFLYSCQRAAAGVFLERARDFLFEKALNPVAAAAGAFGLLALSSQPNTQNPSWRQWIHHLYARFPHLPDGAIAMAQMYLRFGDSDTSAEDELDVEKLRGYALDAVRRGLPYLSFGINPLTEILLMLVQDDEQHQRSGARVEATRGAHRLVLQLGRLATPGSFFTVLELGPVPL